MNMRREFGDFLVSALKCKLRLELLKPGADAEKLKSCAHDLERRLARWCADPAKPRNSGSCPEDGVNLARIPPKKTSHK